jgi:hypothetical protein
VHPEGQGCPEGRGWYEPPSARSKKGEPARALLERADLALVVRRDDPIAVASERDDSGLLLQTHGFQGLLGVCGGGISLSRARSPSAISWRTSSTFASNTVYSIEAASRSAAARPSSRSP